jgi:hypothetical protein
MKILLTAKNAMGDVADYEIHVDSQEDIFKATYRLLGLPGITSAKVHQDYVEVVHSLPAKG